MDVRRAARRPQPRRTRSSGDKEGQRRALFRRRQVCKFCADKIDDINYKDVKLLAPFVPERGKILPRRISGTLRECTAQAADRRSSARAAAAR